MTYHTLERLLLDTAEAIRPPERLTVSEAAEKYRRLNNPGHYIGPWDNSMAPYLVEPMDVLTSLDYTGMVFVGPARTGKSDMFFNWLGHTAICDPSDMLLVHMTQNTARDWSQGDLRKVFRHSPEIGRRVLPGRQNMNVHDIKFLSGMRLLVKWPTITELSGKTVPRQFHMDYDRMDADVDKEGTPYDLARKRGGTFGRYAMCAAESSPGWPIENPRWSPSTPHEAPPTQGILSLYNRGDRRRRYWRCAGCDEPLEPDFKLISYPDSADHVEAAEVATLDCPHCGFCHTHDPESGQPGKHEVDYYGRWVPDNMVWDDNGSLVGDPLRSDIGSFWLKGPAAAFVDSVCFAPHSGRPTHSRRSPKAVAGDSLPIWWSGCATRFSRRGSNCRIQPAKWCSPDGCRSFRWRAPRKGAQHHPAPLPAAAPEANDTDDARADEGNLTNETSEVRDESRVEVIEASESLLSR